MTDFDAGDYEFEFNHTDSVASDNATIEVSDSEADHSIDAPVVTEGDSENITVGLQDTDSAAVQVGDFEENNYEVGFIVEDTEGDYDEVNITMNSYKAGGGHLPDSATGNFDEFAAAWSTDQEDVTLTPGYVNMTDGDEIFVTDAFAEELGYNSASDLDSSGDLSADVTTYGDGIAVDKTFDSPLAA
ncbi:hypothetical protein EL22_28150, partial [Halostagnicola sp. A56]